MKSADSISCPLG